MKAPYCKICGTEHFSTQPCPVRDVGPVTVTPVPTKPRSGGAVALLEKPKTKITEARPKHKIVEGLTQAVEHAAGRNGKVRATAFIGFRLPVSLADRLTAQAKSAGKPASEVVRFILDKALPSGTDPG